MNKDLVLRSVFNVMTRQKRSLTIGGAIFAIVLSCFTGSVFAQSTDQSSDQESPSAETATPIIPIDWAPASVYAQSETNASDDQANANLTVLDWTKPSKFDTGQYSYVAIHSSGLIVEVHTTESITHNGLYYHIGQLNSDTGTITWGPSRLFLSAGAWPAVAITREGYVIITWSDGFYKCCSDLRFLVGTVDLNGGTSQRIDFKTDSKGTKFDSGFHNSISVNGIGVIAEAHESGSGGKGIYYRLGHLTNPAGGDFSISWDTGTNGLKYDDGINPNLSVNDDNNVIEVHNVTGESKTHYIRGKVGLNSRQINFVSPHPRLEGSGRRPNVVLLNNSSIVELSDNIKGIQYITGALSGTNGVKWSEATVINDTDDLYVPSVAANAGRVIATFGDPYGAINKSVRLLYTTAPLP
jgi:hypothetical protein